MKHLINGVEVEMTPEEITAWEAEQAASAPTLEEAVAAKLTELDAYRWEREIGGLDLGGVPVRTDANSQAKVAAAFTSAKMDPGYYVPTWEAVPGVFVELSNAQLVAMGEAVRDHVQDTFTRKAAVYAQIAALETIDDVLAFDIESAWNAIEED